MWDGRRDDEDVFQERYKENNLEEYFFIKYHENSDLGVKGKEFLIVKS